MSRRISWRPAGMRLLGALILVLGLWSAAQLHRQAPSRLPPDIESPGDVAAVLHPEDFKRASRDMELFGGKTMMLIDRARRWLSGPEGAEALAVLIGLVSLVAGAGLILAADRPARDTAPGEDTPPRP